MWIVLLDRSDSMGEPFSASPDSRSRRERLTDAEIKLVAAKEILLEEIGELARSVSGRSVPVVIFAFNSDTEQIFAGTAGEQSTVASRLSAVEADNGTNIAHALDAAADYKVKQGSSSVVRIVLISDGKSNVTEAVQAAQRCLNLSVGIHFILIDPTDEGKEFAREVVGAVGGTSQFVASRSQLKESTQEARRTYAAAQAKAEALLTQSALEAEVIRAETRDREQVEFTAGYLGRMSPETQAPLFVYIHTAAMEAEIEQRLKAQAERFGERLRSSDAEARSLIPLGTALEVTPHIHELVASPTVQQVVWSGELEELAFQLRFTGPPGAPATCAGFIDVTASGLPIAQLPLSIVVDSAKVKSKVQLASAKAVERIFASYSHQDADVVKACKAVYRALGVQLFVDKDNIPTGKEWWDVLRTSISNHDLFQLFWSRTSAISENVADEWRLALSLRPAKGERFLRPVYWEHPMPAPPNELGKLHFGYLDLDTLDRRRPTSKPGRSDAASSGPLAAIRAEFPIIQLIDCDEAIVAALRADFSEVIAFLDHLIGVRYYPPVTFLVDEHLIPTLKPVPQACVSTPPTILTVDEETGHVIALLQCLALAFHVGKLTESENLEFDERAQFYEAANPPKVVEFEHVRRMSEYVFAHPVKAFLEGEDVFARQRKSFADILGAIADTGNADGWNIVRMVRTLSEVATTDEKGRIASVVTEADVDALQSFGDRPAEREKRMRAATKLRDSELPQLATKYGIGLFFGQPDNTQLRFCKSLADYIAGFCRQWVEFAEIALRKCSDKIVNIGFSIPDASLDWLEQHYPTIEVRNRKVEKAFFSTDSESKSDFDLGLRDYTFCVHQLSDRLVARLGASLQTRHFLPAVAATYGVYVSARAAQAQAQFEEAVRRLGWPARASLPVQDKVLICVSAMRRAEDDLRDQGIDAAESASFCRRLALSVLVHEHFHSALARGLDADGQPALGYERSAEWTKADALNEAFAVWCELHFFRHDSKMTAEIEAYMASGDYPQWPYRGGEKIEQIFQKGGLPAVRGWLRHLRDDPANAQLDFDEFIAASS